jgi:hypothetical protein
MDKYNRNILVKVTTNYSTIMEKAFNGLLLCKSFTFIILPNMVKKGIYNSS